MMRSYTGTMRKKTQITFKGQHTLHGPEWILNDLFNENLFEVLNNDVKDVQGYVRTMIMKEKKQTKKKQKTGKQGKEVVKTSSWKWSASKLSFPDSLAVPDPAGLMFDQERTIASPGTTPEGMSYTILNLKLFMYSNFSLIIHLLH